MEMFDHLRIATSTVVLATAIGASLRVDGADQPADDHATKSDVFYLEDDAEPTAYAKERCRLDIYYPTQEQDFATVVWFHGGGLKNGNRFVPPRLKDQGMAVVAVGYRLHPKAEAPAYIEDAAAAVAWVFNHIEEFGGSAQKVFVAGHSAGGYLTSMVGLDKRWLAVHDHDADQIAGLIPFSGQTVTHSTIRAERGIATGRPILDDLAPLYHAREDAAPILLITGDRELELRGRYEENAYLWRLLKLAGHTDVSINELQGYNHVGMAEPGYPLLLKFVRRVTSKRSE